MATINVETGHFFSCNRSVRNVISKTGDQTTVKPIHCNHIKSERGQNTLYCQVLVGTQSCGIDGIAWCGTFHWKTHCRDMGWWPEISECLNIVFDRLDIDLEERIDIVFDGRCLDVTGVDPANHLSKRLTEQLDEYEPTNGSDDDASDDGQIVTLVDDDTESEQRQEREEEEESDGEEEGLVGLKRRLDEAERRMEGIVTRYKRLRKSDLVLSD